MPRLTIDGQPVNCPEGSTILVAARLLGIEIPTLCHADGFEPGVSCMVCVVKVAGVERLLPACATPAAEGMVVETRTPEVIESRRVALELLLSDHRGDCDAPCHLACPAGMEIPEMLRAIVNGPWEDAGRLAAERLVIPEILGYVCPAPCEKVCRRAQQDAAVAIRPLHREAARRHRGEPVAAAPSTGCRVAVVGAGPAGLAAARELARLGHACTLIEQHAAAGGALRSALDEAALPRAVLDAETAAIIAMPGITPSWQHALRDADGLAELLRAHDAVVLAFGHDPAVAERLGLETGALGVRSDARTGRTADPRVFVAGGAAAPIRKLAVRAVASGLKVAAAVDRMLRGLPDTVEKAPLQVRFGALSADERALLMTGANPAPRADEPADGIRADAAIVTEAARCMHCDCRAAQNCALRRLGREYVASPRAFAGPRREIAVDASHAELIYESGKCISCGLCAQVAEQQGENPGLTFVSRGFAVRMAPALDRTLAEALHGPAEAYAAICPTGALKLKAAANRGCQVIGP